jgi:hypothetical protein
VATLVEHVKINGHRVRGGMPFPAVPPHGARSEQVILLGSPDWDSALLAPPVLVPQLEHRLLATVVGCQAALSIIIQAFRVVGRSEL